MCVMCIDICSYKLNRKNITRDQHSEKVRNVLLTHAWQGNRRNNDIILNCKNKYGEHLHRCAFAFPGQWKLHSVIVYGTYGLRMDLKNINQIPPKITPYKKTWNDVT